MTPSAVRVANYRARQRELNLPDVTRRLKKLHDADYRRVSRQRASDRPFTGCDGEGCGTDDLGRQLYMLFRMGDRELYTGKHLSTIELLDFICDHPADELLVGFAFGYDVTMILRDLPEGQARKLFRPHVMEKGHSPFVWFHEFDIDYLPKQYFKVRRVEIVRHLDGSEQRIAVSGSTRTIWETFGFFQKGFAKVIKEFGVGSEAERELIIRNKAARETFAEISPEVRTYCGLECRMLSELMEKLRQYCNGAGIRPRSWSGAGKLASALLAQHETPIAADLNILKPVADLANMAYYGGRFEITRTGLIREPIYEYDIRSAYPDAMRFLPCLVHGRFEKASRKRLLNHHGLYITPCTFRASGDGEAQLGGLPIRSKKGHIFWPLAGGGVYWSVEIESARLLGFETHIKSGGWIFHKNCDCRPFDWVETLYEYRRSIGSSGPGYPIKLGINSLYGKQAQRVGNGKYNNMVWAGLITAMTRAKLNQAIARAPGKIVMLATDGIYSTEPLPTLPVGEFLGQWETSTLNGLFIVQPGLYWCPEKRKRKSRGLSGRFFEQDNMTERFEKDWLFYHDQIVRSQIEASFPSVPVPVPGFVGLKLALARNKPEQAGRWVKDTRNISFDYSNKRQGHFWNDTHIVTGIIPGSMGLQSLPHKDFLSTGGHEPWEQARLMLEEQPDYIDLQPPFEDD